VLYTVEPSLSMMIELLKNLSTFTVRLLSPSVGLLFHEGSRYDARHRLEERKNEEKENDSDEVVKDVR
jgi:hypothetical protein